jgi:hypothetical protein
MIANKILAIGILIPILILSAPNVYASSLGDAQRYNDGCSNGAQAAATDSTYNPTCDPTGAYTSDGQHTTTYCTGWANGYTATWNANHGGQPSQPYTGGQPSQPYTGSPVYPQPQHPSLTTQAYNACVQHLGICTAVLKAAACSLFGVCI